MADRTCTKCGETFPETTEFFGKRSDRLGGLRRQCRSCCKERAREWWQKHPEQTHAARALWAAENPEKVKASGARWRAANPEQAKASGRRWEAAHPDEARESARLWESTHPEERAAMRRNRRARERNADGTHTAEDVRAQYMRQSGHCYWCAKRVAKDYHVDHVIPLSKGGANGPENLVIACPTCNRKKSSKLPQEFALRLC